MKRNKLFLLGLFVVFAAVLSLSLVSSTFAKYVTSDNGQDTARVAKWGVTVTVEGSMFAKTYSKDDNTFAEANTVVGTTNLLAPGTKGDMAAIQLDGDPEVAVRVTYAADLVLSGWDVQDGTATYLPVIIVIDGVEYSAAGTGCETAADFEALIEAKIAEHSNDYAAGTNLNLNLVSSEYLTISWKWAYSGNDALDTALGNLGTAPTIELTITCTVTQID